ncbi:hypothetical protein H7R52_11715 [Weissella confusa]|uniref:Uncharacterized protein n=1 Tax=Weissella confusa TaxID=1583 RepID=A0A923SNM9_WEICO|nr:hypothetical protein [Weissella confusa]
MFFGLSPVFAFEKSVNVFGSFPSYHNTWAALAVFFGVVALREHRSVLGVICVVFGLLITLSTFLLHQHAVLDAVFTYARVMAWFAGRERLFWQYFTVSSLVYVISTVIYAVMPTVTIPHDFLVGPIQVLSKDSAFYSQIAVLDS